MILHTKNGIAFQTVENPAFQQEACRLRHDVYLEVGYINHPFHSKIIPDEQDTKSTYIVASDSNQKLLGTIRLTPGPPFKTFNVWKNKYFPQTQNLIKTVANKHSMELGALAVVKTARNKHISWGLYKAAYLFALIKKIDYYVIGIDVRVFRTLEKLGVSIVNIGSPMHYMGSLTVPGVIPIAMQLCSVYEKNQDYYKYLIQ